MSDKINKAIKEVAIPEYPEENRMWLVSLYAIQGENGCCDEELRLPLPTLLTYKKGKLEAIDRKAFKHCHSLHVGQCFR